MWRVTFTSTADGEQFPSEDLVAVRTKIWELHRAGCTVSEGLPAELVNGVYQRQRDFTTLESADSFADTITNLPSGLVTVISIVEINNVVLLNPT
jgi:hypothetical protein